MTLPTLWSLVTLPTCLGRVASDYFVLFSWPCSHENKARQISLFVVACDPTYFWGRVASDYFLALPTPPLVAWPYLLSDRLWPYRQFVTLAMGFAWQVQQFRCLRDVVPWPYTCLLGRVASDRHWLFVAGAIFSMPPRSSLWPYFLFVWQVQYFRVLREVLRGLTFFLCGRCNIFDASEKFLRDPGPWSLVTPPRSFFASEKFSVTLRKVACDPIAPFCVAGANVWRQWWPYFLFVRQVQYFRCLREVPLLCGRRNIFDAFEKFPVTLLPFCRQCDFVTLKPFPHPSPHPKTPVPPSYTLKGGCTYKAICLSTMWFCHFETLSPPQSPP